MFAWESGRLIHPRAEPALRTGIDPVDRGRRQAGKRGIESAESEGTGLVGESFGKDGLQRIFQHLSILRVQLPQSSDYETVFNRRDNRLDHRGSEQPSPSPILQKHLTDGLSCFHLAGYSHDDQVRMALLVGLRADNNRRTPLAAGLVSEREGNQNGVTEAIACRTRHPLGYPILAGMKSQM